MASLLTMSNKRGKLMNVLHVSIITKNLVSNRQIVHRGMQVWFKHLRCFIEEKGKVIVQGHREGGMFVLKCLRKGKRSSRISTYGTSGSTISTSHSFETCTRRTSFSLPVREGTPTSIPQQMKSEPESARPNPFRYMGTDTQLEHVRKPLHR